MTQGKGFTMPFFNKGNGEIKKKGKKRGWLDILILLLLGGGGAALVWFAVMNMAPYKALLDNSAIELTKNGFVQFIYWLPLIGAVAKWIGSSIVWIGGFMIWLPIQIVEILPGVLWRHQGFLSAVAKAHDELGVVSIKDNDPMSIKSAKNALNNLIGGFLDNMFIYCIGAYIIDAIICVWYYPIMPGIAFDKAVQYLMIGQLKYVDKNNLFGVISTLFAVEVIIHVMISVYMLYQFLRRSK